MSFHLLRNHLSTSLAYHINLYILHGRKMEAHSDFLSHPFNSWQRFGFGYYILVHVAEHWMFPAILVSARKIVRYVKQERSVFWPSGEHLNQVSHPPLFWEDSTIEVNDQETLFMLVGNSCLRDGTSKSTVLPHTHMASGTLSILFVPVTGSRRNVLQFMIRLGRGNHCKPPVRLEEASAVDVH